MIFNDQKEQNNVEERDQTWTSSINELPQSWKVVQDKYEVLGALGQGNYGVVMLAQNRLTNEKVAIKYQNNIFENQYRGIKILREIQIMKQLQKMENNKFTVKLIEILQPEVSENEDIPDEIFIVMEYYKFDLETLLTQSINFTEDHVKQIIYNILSALNFIHSANIIHRDLKPSNILLDENCNVRICDFGLSRTMSVSSIEKGSGNSKRIRDSVMQFKLKEIIDDQHINLLIANKLKTNKQARLAKKRVLSDHVCSRWYRAPEICILEKHYDFSADMWSAGCIFYELYKKLENQEEENESFPMFKGESCFPLSPFSNYSMTDENSAVDEAYQTHQNDQVKIIMDKLGFQSDLDFSFVQEKYVKQYLKKLNQKNEKINFQKIFEGKNPKLLKILQNILQLNPYFRPSASECLQNPVFQEVRIKDNETKSPFKIFLDIDRDGAFDYENPIFFNQQDIIQLKYALAKEILS